VDGVHARSVKVPASARHAISCALEKSAWAGRQRESPSHIHRVSRDQRRLLALQLALGPAVLGSYVYGFAFWPDAVAAMWGGVPESMRDVYTAWMFVAAAGYLVFTPALFVHASGAPRLLAMFAAVLAGSVLWMPLTKWHLEGAVPFPLVVLDLWLVAAGSLALLATTRRTALPGAWRIAAPLGAAAFCVQTVLLDAIVWPLFWK
jgi:hypothetical protein